MAYIQLERRALLALCYWSAGTDLVVLTFQLLLIRLQNCHFFLFCFVLFCFNFIFSLSVSIEFLEVLFVSLPSFTHSLPPAPDKRVTQPFVLLQAIRSTVRAFLAYAKSTGCFVVWKTLHWLTLVSQYWNSSCNTDRTADDRLKDWKFLSTAFGKRTSSFSQKNKTSTTTTIKIGKQNRV